MTITRRVLAVTALSFLVLPGLRLEALGQAAANGAQPAPDDRARQWLALIDDANYAESWKQAGPSFQARLSAERWAREAAAVRQPLGAMTGRSLKDVKLSKTLPGMPDGQYAVVRYDSTFAHKAAAIESVALAFNKASWAVIGYHIN